MVILDISAVNVALPDLGKDLGIAGGDLGWAITAYSLVFGSLLLLGGRAADLLGRRRVFLAGLGVFTVASLASALANSESRVLRRARRPGPGAPMLSPAALSIITTTFQGPERARALGVWGAVGGAGAAIGVLLGGDPHRARRLARHLPHQPARRHRRRRSRHEGHPRRHRPPAVARPRPPRRACRHREPGRLVYALSQAADAGWTSPQTLGLGLGGLAGLAVFAAMERHAIRPYSTSAVSASAESVAVS